MAIKLVANFSINDSAPAAQRSNEEPSAIQRSVLELPSVSSTLASEKEVMTYFFRPKI